MTSRSRPVRTPAAGAPDPVRTADPADRTDPADTADTADAADAADAGEAPVQLTRRERRAAARGGPAQKIAGPAAGRLVTPPVRHRDYAARKHG
jgi:hypothetical protein